MRLIDADEFLTDESEAYMKAQIALAERNADKTIDANRYINQLVHRKIQMLIADAPTIEPKRGEWIYGEHDVAMCDGYRCDKCGFFVPWDYEHKSIDFINDYHFCPNCGADMLKESE